MLPSRGILRSLPSGGLQRQLASQSVSRTSLSRNLGNGRQFSTSLKGTGAGLRISSSVRVGSGRCVAPVLLGSAASSSRNLSLWGWGWGGKKEGTNDAAVDTASEALPAAATDVSTTQSTAAAVDTAAPISEAVSQTPADGSVLASDIDLSAIANLGSASDILNMPEDIGYLSALGLDYGWGPTSVMQWVIEHVHVYSGLGWGGSIIATALLLRAVMFVPQVKSLQFSAAMNKVKEDPRSKEALQLVKQGYQTGDREMLAKGQFLNKMIREQHDAKNSGMLWSFIQIPFSFGLFRIIGGMAHVPVPSLENAGFLWFPDLTATDPYFILPAIGSSLLFGSVLLNSKYAPPQQKALMKKMMWLMGTVGFIGTTFLSAGVNLMMVSTGAATFLTAALLNTPAIRRLVGLPLLPVREEPKYEAPRPATSSGVSGMRERLTNNLDDMKKGLSDQMANYTGKYGGTEEEKAEQKRKENLRKIEELRRKLEREEFEKKYKSKR